MFLKSLFLQNFRSHKRSESNFSKGTTLVVGPNTAGKTNLIEAIFFLSTGKSFRGTDKDVILFGEDVARIKANLTSGKSEDSLEIVFANRKEGFIKKYLVNGVSKQRVKFVGNLPSVLFAPMDLEIVTASPGVRRSYLDFVLEQADRDYRQKRQAYDKGIRNRNRLLENSKKSGRRDQRLFDYWDNLLIENGDIITRTRADFIDFINKQNKDFLDFYIEYERSIISKERLLQYKDAEVATGVTLVGPHRDDICFLMHPNKDLKAFGSRGQQRLGVLQLKIIELEFLTQKLGEKPLLLLDDIFSELDEEHIRLVLEMISGQQTVITTTHKEFVGDRFLEKASVIELGK